MTWIGCGSLVCALRPSRPACTAAQDIRSSMTSCCISRLAIQPAQRPALRLSKLACDAHVKLRQLCLCLEPMQACLHKNQDGSHAAWPPVIQLAIQVAHESALRLSKSACAAQVRVCQLRLCLEPRPACILHRAVHRQACSMPPSAAAGIPAPCNAQMVSCRRRREARPPSKAMQCQNMQGVQCSLCCLTAAEGAYSSRPSAGISPARSLPVRLLAPCSDPPASAPRRTPSCHLWD